jgi:energy-coupling factor transporter ATP-binding protein EcfA2
VINDENPINSTIVQNVSKITSPSTTKVKIRIQFDEYPEECSWTIKNDLGTTIYSKDYSTNTPADLSTVEEIVDLPNLGLVKTESSKKMIDVFNQRLNFYLKKLQAPCKCEFDELFEETIFNDKGKECSYFNFSGGERKRIDVAILFMFQDVLRLHTGTSFSLNFYDELFDSALDDNGIEKIIEILKNKVEKYEESIYIISHKNHTKVNVDNVLFLEKNNGITTLVG